MPQRVMAASTTARITNRQHRSKRPSRASSRYAAAEEIMTIQDIVSAAVIDAKQAGYKYIAACACGPHVHGKCRRPTRRVICSTCHQPLTYVQQYLEHYETHL